MISSKWAKKRLAIHPVARPKTRGCSTSRNLAFDRSTIEHELLYLTSFTEKKKKNRLKAKVEDAVSSFPRTRKHRHVTTLKHVKSSVAWRGSVVSCWVGLALTCQPLASLFPYQRFRFSLFFAFRDAQQSTVTLQRVLCVKHRQKVCARNVRNFANKTNQSSKFIVQSSDATVASSSPTLYLIFPTKLFLHLTSARRFEFSQNKTDKRSKRKASCSIDNSHCELLWCAYEIWLWHPSSLPLEGLRKEDKESSL